MSELEPILGYALMCKDVYSNYKTIGDVGYIIAVESANRQIIITFKGSSNFIDLIEDVELCARLLPKCFIHLDEIYVMAQAFQANYPDYEIISVGHSLGGSFAQCLMLKHKIRIYTFNAYGVLNVHGVLDDANFNDSDYQLGLNFRISSDVVSGSSLPWQAGQVVSWDLSKDFADKYGYFSMNERQHWRFCHNIDTIIALLNEMIAADEAKTN